ncbi:MAG TPA: MFS transporter [Thermoanaerobaculia bacterium]|jgi:EmrB/QacA subfamily drug resistance transporter|nr:MFS transporter [Thermoanaerobaculia bacterium]
MRRWVLAATILGSAMAFIDTTVVNVALPVIQRDLHASVSDAQWIVDAYLLVLSSLILAGGSLGDRLGRTRVFSAGILLFAGASIWCGAAGSTNQLIAARALQGAGAALLVPGSLAIIAATFPREERGRAIGTWSALTSLAIILGPLLGGVLVQTISWRAVFLINAPIAAIVLLILWRKVPSDNGERSGAIDWLGTLLVTLGLGGVVFAFIEAPARGWSSASVLIAMIGGVLSLIAFLFVERRAEQPIVPFELFRSRAFTGANLLTLLLYAALSAATFLLPFNLIQVQGYTPSQAGAAFLPFVVTMSLLSRWSGALADRIGARPLLLGGPLIAAAGLALLAWPGVGGSYWTTFFPGLLVLGIGMALTVAPLTTTVMTSINDERHAGAASGINNAVARAAGLLSIALLGAAAVGLFSRELDSRLADAGAPVEVRRAMAAQSLHLAAAEPPPGADEAMVRSAVRHAFVRAFRVTVLAAAVLAALSCFGALGVQSRSAVTQN